MSLFSFLGVLSPVHMIWTLLFCRAKFVGEDVSGNKYYRAAPRKGYKRERRWVVYQGAPEASKVVPEWHGWLHYQTDIVPSDSMPSFRRPWQKPHIQNMTGTRNAYRPPGHILSGGQREKATGDYEAWQPPE